MPESDEPRAPSPTGRQLVTTVSFQYPREKWQILRAVAAKRDQSIAELCRQAVERHLAELVESNSNA